MSKATENSIVTSSHGSVISNSALLEETPPPSECSLTDDNIDDKDQVSCIGHWLLTHHSHFKSLFRRWLCHLYYSKCWRKSRKWLHTHAACINLCKLNTLLQKSHIISCSQKLKINIISQRPRVVRPSWSNDMWIDSSPWPLKGCSLPTVVPVVLVSY